MPRANDCGVPLRRGAAPTVQAGQQIGFDQIRDGINGKQVHQNILDLFEARGFRTGRMDGRMQGFFHGTGHGLGLDIHEAPRIAPGRRDW